MPSPFPIDAAKNRVVFAPARHLVDLGDHRFAIPAMETTANRFGRRAAGEGVEYHASFHRLAGDRELLAGAGFDASRVPVLACETGPDGGSIFGHEFSTKGREPMAETCRKMGVAEPNRTGLSGGDLV